jgi:hypothetical protein
LAIGPCASCACSCSFAICNCNYNRKNDWQGAIYEPELWQLAMKHGHIKGKGQRKQRAESRKRKAKDRKQKAESKSRLTRRAPMCDVRCGFVVSCVFVWYMYMPICDLKSASRKSRDLNSSLQFQESRNRQFQQSQSARTSPSSSHIKLFSTGPHGTVVGCFFSWVCFLLCSSPPLPVPVNRADCKLGHVVVLVGIPDDERR